MAEDFSPQESQPEKNTGYNQDSRSSSKEGHHHHHRHHRRHRSHWKERKKGFKKWLTYVLISVGALIILLLSVIIGLKLDAKLNASPLFSRATPILALVILFSFLYKRFYR